MTNTCWIAITEKEFKYWLTEIGKTHTIFHEESKNTKEVMYFVENIATVKSYVLSKYTTYGDKVHYYKNENVVGS